MLKTKELNKFGGVVQLGSGKLQYPDILPPLYLSSRGKVIITNSQLVFFRTHEKSVSTTTISKDEYLEWQNNYRVEKKSFERKKKQYNPM